jgi:riboflavin kinase/FMN adenylyltransferase
MQHYWSLEDVHLNSVWLTIGSFDGVHLGHQAILRRLSGEAHLAQAQAVVLTFFPHPAVVLGKRNNRFYLNTPDERAALLGKFGVDIVITHKFDERVASTPAYEFVSQLYQHLKFKRLIVGPDFALGHNRQGNLPTLQKYGEQLGYILEVVQPTKVDEQIVSSSTIRTAILGSNVERAKLLMGRPYCISGKVIPGDGRGKTIGIPTANLQIWEHKVIPGAGVYICTAEVNGNIFKAVTNVGVRPTFESEPVPARVETYILDFNQDLYGTTISLNFLVRLRAEQKFVDVNSLVNQIHTDIQKTRQWFNN